MIEVRHREFVSIRKFKKCKEFGALRGDQKMFVGAPFFLASNRVMSRSDDQGGLNHKQQQKEKPMPKAKEKTPPAHEVRLGRIKAAIWKNETDKGPRYNTTLSRIYLDEGEWKPTESFGRDDLLLLAKVADQAHSWICEQPREQEEG